MIKSIKEMNIHDYMIKEGDIKVDAGELRHLFLLIEKYHIMIANTMLDELSEDERIKFNDDLQFVEYVQNKYIVLGDLRRKQKLWYDTMKKLEKKDFTKDATQEEIDNFKREIWEYYLEAKTERENLQKEIERLKEKFEKMLTLYV